MQKTQRILIVDQSAPFRATLAHYLTFLDADYLVIGEAATDEAALREVARLQPQIVLLDLDLPDRTGLKTTRDIRHRWPEIAVIAVKNHLDCEYSDAARAAGALNCLDKLALVEQLPAVLATLSASPPTYLSAEEHSERPYEPP